MYGSNEAWFILQSEGRNCAGIMQRRYRIICPLDEAAFAAYGWPSDLSDEEILEKLLALNLERSKTGK